MQADTETAISNRLIPSITRINAQNSPTVAGLFSHPLSTEKKL